MASMISEPYTTTSLEAKQNADFSFNKIDERNSFSATRVSVITSTNSLPSVTPSSNNNIDNAVLAATTKSSEKRDESKKPYGGRPLKYECPQCQRRFHAPSHLKRHVMSHSSERPFQCSVCGKGFLQAWHLGRHMTTHTGNKPFKCIECSKSFGSRFEMRTHINYIHKGIKEHKCDVCGKHFTLRSNLKVHMRKHTGEKPYQCNFCSKRFGQRGHLQYHIRKHEGKDDCILPQHLQHSDITEKSSKQPRKRVASVSDHDCHDDDGECDSGIGSYSDTELSICSSPVLHENCDDQPFSFNKTNKQQDRPSSPEFGIIETPNRSPLKKTCRETHVRELKPYVCYSCNCGFSEISSLRAHVRHSHPRKGIDVGDFRCAFCLRSYSSMEMLQHHIQKHQFSEAHCMPGYVSQKMELNHSEAIHDKPKMSAKSLAFSIESICADASPKTSPKPTIISPFSDICSSPPHNPMLCHMVMSSIPLASTFTENMAVAHCRSEIQSHIGSFCKCHLNMQNLHIR